MQIHPFKAVYPRLDYITSNDSFFQNVKEEYPDYKESGFFTKASKPGIYLYQIRQEERTFNGIIACSAIEDYLEGHIKRHENTLPEKEQRQIHLLLRRNAIVKPILLTYPRVSDIDLFIHQHMETGSPFLEVVFDQPMEVHRLWEVNEDAAIQQLQHIFSSQIPKTFIADGHHRCSILALMHQRSSNPGGNHSYDRILSAFFRIRNWRSMNTTGL